MAIQVLFSNGLGGGRINDSDTNTNWGNFNVGGGSPAAEAQLRYQGQNVVNKKITASDQPEGILYNHSTTVNMTQQGNTLYFMKGIIADFADLNTTEGCRLEIGSAAAASYEYVVAGSAANNPALATYPSQGGYLIVPINPSIAAWREVTNGSPNLTAVDYWAFGGRFIDGTAKSENVALDAIDVGSGLQINTTDGTGTGTFVDFLDFDQNTVNNRYGVVFGTDAAFTVTGTLFIGTSITQPITFTDNSTVLSFFDGYQGPGDVGLELNLQDSGTAITLGGTYIGLGNATTSDTRPDLTVTNTAGSATLTGAFTNFRNIVLNSATTVDGASMEFEDLTQGGASIDGATLTNTNTNTNTAAIDDPTFGTTSGIRNTTFIQGGTGPALNVTSNVTFTNINFSGYSGLNGEPVINNSSNDVVITRDANTPTFAVRQTGLGGSITTVGPARSFELTGLKDRTEVRLVNSATNTEIAGVENVIGGVGTGINNGGGTVTVSGTTDDNTFNYAYQYSSDVNIDAAILSSSAFEVIYLASSLQDSDKSIPIQQQPDRNYNNPV